MLNFVLKLYFYTSWIIKRVDEHTFHVPVHNVKNIHIPNCWIFVEWWNLNFVLKLLYYTTSWLIERANDRGVHDILIHFQEKVWNFENKFGVATHHITKYTYSKLLNSCWMTKLKLCSQTFLLYNILNHRKSEWLWRTRYFNSLSGASLELWK